MGNVTKQASTRFSMVKRSKGQPAVEKASYISRSILVSEFDGQTYRPKRHEDLVHSEITFPPNAPKEYDSIGKEQTNDRKLSQRLSLELAYAEVISYNKKNLERELQNESRQHDGQQNKTKRREEEI